MLSQTTSPPLTVTVLAALWVSLSLCVVSESPGPGCDTGKLHLDRDLPEEDVYWDCPMSTWPVQTHPSIDTVYNAEPVRQICMDQSISYNRSIPNSGVYRPIRAESGEYLYCPPQRWINNLHHSATVLLYHPCAPLHERRLLSVLARSCLSDYIITPHHQLSEHTPIALVSWARTLELSTVATSDTCDWLETTTHMRNTFGGVRSNRMYNYLLTWSAEQQHPEEHRGNKKESVRRCCEEIISSKQMEAKIRAIREKPTNRTTEDVQNHNSTLGPSADTSKGNRMAPSQSSVKNIDQGFRPRPLLGSNTLRTHSLGGAQKSRLKNPKPAVVSDVTLNGEHKARDETWISSSKDKVPESVMKEKDATGGLMKDNEVVDVKERELGHEPESRSQSEPQQNPDPATYPPSSADCDSCSAGELCKCSENSEAQPAEVNKGFPRTPRSDEAVWAAAALGFLLVLLTLSVLHTRLYRQWRTTPSLYWHDPQLGYDSVADVIRRRLQIAKRRRKRRRRQECVLLPSSSSSDELS